MTENKLKTFVVFISPTVFVRISAHRVDYGSSMVYFQMMIPQQGDGPIYSFTYECVASFPYDNICGWAEVDHVLS